MGRSRSISEKYSNTNNASKQHISRIRSLLTVVVGLSFALIIATVIGGWAPIPKTADLLFWSTISLIISLSIIKLPVGGGVVTSLGEIVDLAAFAVVGPYPILISNVIGAFGRSLILGRSDPIRDLFNLSQWNLASLIAFFAYSSIYHSLVPMFSLQCFLAIICAWFMYSTITTGLVTIAVSISNNSHLYIIWKQNYLREFFVSLASSPLALIMAVIYVEHRMLPVLLLVFPLIVLSIMVGSWIETASIQARADRNRKLADMGKITATLLHELSRPLNRIVVVSDYAVSGGMSHEKALETVGNEALAACRLSERLMGAMKVKITKSPVLIGVLLNELIIKLKNENIPFALNCADKNYNLTGYWDADLIVAALINLVKNAWESQGMVGEAPLVAVETQSSSGGSVMQDSEGIITFSVADQGPGLPSGIENDVFDALYSTKESGFGIGLFLANHIALAHDGILQAHNAESNGAVFSIQIPLKSH